MNLPPPRFPRPTSPPILPQRLPRGRRWWAWNICRVLFAGGAIGALSLTHWVDGTLWAVMLGTTYLERP